MMAWSVIRTATQGDVERLETAAQRFATRHQYGVVKGWNYVELVECNTAESDYAYHRQLWRRIVRRVLQHSRAEGIAWGAVGFHVS